MQCVKVGHFASVASRALCSSGVCCPGVINVSACCRVHCSVIQTRFCQTVSTVIRVPRYMQKRVEDVKQTRGKNKINTIKAGRLLIQSRNPELNQSAGYILGKFEEPALCSKGWKHNRSFGDYFTINNLKAVAPFVAEEQKKDADEKTPVTFDNLRICKELVETLDNINITKPTTVQLQTIPKVMRGHNILCAAETGSGKTLSYLLPVVHKLQAEKASDMYGESAKIRTVVLVPSRELAEQVAAVSRTVCAPFGLQTSTVGGGRGVGHIKMVFKRGSPDILVATPGALVKALRRRCLDLSELRFLVVDEADTMFDPSFSDMLESILHQTHIASNPRETQGPGHKAQLLVVGATFPGGVGEVLSQVTDLGSMVVIKSKMLHFLMPHVKQTFLKVKGTDKVLELHQALKLLQQEKGGGAVVVFCNKSTTVNWLGYSLEEMGVQHARLQGEMPAAVRAGIFRSFQRGMTDVLICTDIASRGLDTSRVRLVVNYDFPESHTDYIHRAGRVGRAGGVEDGEVLSFVTHPWDVELVQKIETAARRRTSLPGMESHIHEPKPKIVEPEE
ncbi:probable ATP-dependent RNA helicase DDX28 [Thunnus albacares]|uniref:probable ATP-dependent RNA helicase DDX28 n=1 Tax=Thunnus maccoyii TaxID=8240 RepID=UPI001C4C26AB|nr:probable ATP-dependent RNA helicase DDX28 [Thunnus maccoyii]XP_044216506.1 probable ATP-dependent RNA helicase DDX28 [Thunnus albacares]|eukprot:superscaffoldBa00000205_g2692